MFKTIQARPVDRVRSVQGELSQLVLIRCPKKNKEASEIKQGSQARPNSLSRDPSMKRLAKSSPSVGPSVSVDGSSRVLKHPGKREEEVLARKRKLTSQGK